MFKVAILGCENSHANIFLNAVLVDKLVDDVEFVGVYSDYKDAAQQLSEKYGVYAAESYDEFVGKVDGIVITARHGDAHYKFAKPYIESGIPMFIDKPITCTEEDAKAFMAELQANGNRVCGGSVCALTDHVQALKKAVKEETYGPVYGGFVRAPLNIEEEYGGFFFYSMHLVHVMTEIFGSFPKSAYLAKNGGENDVYTGYVTYDDKTVSIQYKNLCYASVYYAGISCEKKYVGDEYGFDGCFEKEFMEFYDLLKGGEMKETYEQFFAPVYILNALYNSLQSGKEEEVKRA